MKRQLLAFIWVFTSITYMSDAQAVLSCTELKNQYDSVQKQIQNLNRQMYISQQKLKTLKDLHDQAEDLLEEIQNNNCPL